MDAGYTPFDIVVWLLFLCFWVCVYATVRWYHARYPHYPEAAGIEKKTPAGKTSAVGRQDVEDETDIF